MFYKARLVRFSSVKVNYELHRAFDATDNIRWGEMTINWQSKDIRERIFKTYPSVVWLDRCIQCNFRAPSPVERNWKWWQTKEMKIHNFCFFFQYETVCFSSKNKMTRFYRSKSSSYFNNRHWSIVRRKMKKRNKRREMRKVSNVKLNEIMFGVFKNWTFSQYVNKENWLHWQWDCFILP